MHWSLNPSIPYPRRKVFPSACCSGDFSTNQPQLMSWILPYHIGTSRYVCVFFFRFLPWRFLLSSILLHEVKQMWYFSQKGSVACPFWSHYLAGFLFCFLPFPKKPYEMCDNLNQRFFASYFGSRLKMLLAIQSHSDKKELQGVDGVTHQGLDHWNSFGACWDVLLLLSN